MPDMMHEIGAPVLSCLSAAQCVMFDVAQPRQLLPEQCTPTLDAVTGARMILQEYIQIIVIMLGDGSFRHWPKLISRT